MKFYDLTFPRKEAKRAAVKRHGWDRGRRREEGKDRRGTTGRIVLLSLAALLGGTMGRKKGHSRKLDSLPLSTRDRGAPEGRNREERV